MATTEVVALGSEEQLVIFQSGVIFLSNTL